MEMLWDPLIIPHKTPLLGSSCWPVARGPHGLGQSNVWTGARGETESVQCVHCARERLPRACVAVVVTALAPLKTWPTVNPISFLIYQPLGSHGID